ncbi:roadblock/LC7 domain-containing protein [Geothrix fermentans]|jgi:predicted regulator of Ras-like GTPase activity (Roadblock/LC7/MglB family)|uniref:roadblock/LC7 domain-containing protein n=1 Tax=Geothrix fermentans TaxID=44676 RepID=UPI0003FD5FBB|nr:roadblock/LC7 domain-containing protein [Geothrix fermentans]
MFQQLLDQLIEQVPEALAATFNDRDGDPICSRTIQVSNEGLQLLGAYQHVVKRHLQQAVEEFDRGEVKQVAFATEQHWILMMGAKEQCTLVLVMRRDGLLGRARFFMEKAVEALNAEL